MQITGNKKQEAKVSAFCEKYGIDKETSPTHVAIIMDGNGRWAKQKNLPRVAGHKKGVDSIKACIENCMLANVRYLSIYAFSTENWSRPETEVTFLMNLFRTLLKRDVPKLHKEGIRVRCLGDLSELPQDIQEQITTAHALTEDNTYFQVNIMVNYGSRREITQAITQIAESYKTDSLKNIDEDTLSRYLYTKDIPDPDILIRTSGEHRLSNFLLWQLTYSEFFFTDIMWPDFNDTELAKIIVQFQNRDRRYGGLTS